jgi:hypothetical protein
MVTCQLHLFTCLISSLLFFTSPSSTRFQQSALSDLHNGHPSITQSKTSKVACSTYPQAPRLNIYFVNLISRNSSYFFSSHVYRRLVMMMMMIFINVQRVQLKNGCPVTSRRVWGRTKLWNYIVGRRRHFKQMHGRGRRVCAPSYRRLVFGRRKPFS